MACTASKYIPYDFEYLIGLNVHLVQIYIYCCKANETRRHSLNKDKQFFSYFGTYTEWYVIFEEIVFVCICFVRKQFSENFDTLDLTFLQNMRIIGSMYTNMTSSPQMLL
jgi:hypothetical protein